ncbi:methyltransferase family protein [Vulgatibacter incomptus]|uniref:Putative CONSERVED INTEGRAL MEMBRANE PROTEIN n=1 Tax=Vulgatibacter incomptus TaxID=1391653 RepID=A0A0K1PCK6_9BACT|nr:isoprenylcysteine carboxylmethyltransferase family protein [Vulgatibacter incomptus]AKU90854.1 putative CONSERVED INTEGRAL MEMBRANE PROTEIN [Vulgatibacter incomptus]
MDALDAKAWIGIVRLAMVLGLATFLPAWTLAWWQAWTCIGVFVACAGAITAYLVRHDRALLARRVRAGPAAEKEFTQKVIQSLAFVAFLAVFVVPALDRRFGWSRVPIGISIVGDGVVVLGFWIVFRVLRENTFASAAIEVTSEQRVISTGPYAYVRHPMYSGALLLIVGVPPALGSWVGLGAVAPFALVIVWRLRDEERFLAKSLEGYESYCARVRYRLVPLVW